MQLTFQSASSKVEFHKFKICNKMIVNSNSSVCKGLPLKEVPKDKKPHVSGKVSRWMSEHKILVTLGIVLASIAVAGVVSVALGVLPIVVLPGIAAVSIAATIAYIGSRLFKSDSKVKNPLPVEIKSTEQRKEEIRQKFQSLPRKTSEEIGADVEETLKKIADEIRMSPFIKDDEIKKTVADFFEKLVTSDISPEEKVDKQKQLLVRINEALVARELCKKGWVVGNNLREIELLEKLGYKINDYSPYRDYEILYGVITILVKSELEELNKVNPTSLTCPSREIIRSKLKELALKAKLETIEITGLKVEKFQAILDFDQKVKEEASKKHREIEISIPTFIDKKKNPKTAEFLESEFQKLKELLTDYAIESYVANKHCRKYFRDEKYPTANFKTVFDKKVSPQVTSIINLINQEARIDDDSIISMLSKFFQKWINFLQIECFQGLGDSHEVLGAGVCYALNLRVEELSQDKPDLDPICLGVDVTEADRIKQAHYQLGIHLANKDPDKAILIRDRFDYNKDEFNHTIRSLLPELPKSHGWLNLAIQSKAEAHAISFRFDEERGLVWLLDSNIGLFTFNQEGRKFATAMELCLECYNDIMSMKYSEYKTVEIKQRILTK